MRDSPLIQEFIEEGVQKGRRAALADLLAARFGEKKARPLLKPLDAITNRARLEELFLKVAKARGFAQVEKLFKAE
jgi:hypothetical protein